MLKGESLSGNIKKAIFKNMMFYIISAAVFFISSGTIYYLRGWIFYIIVVSGAIFNNYILIKNNPEVLEVRAEKGVNSKGWDKII